MNVVFLLILLVPKIAICKTIEYKCSYPKYASIEGIKTEKSFELTFMIDETTKKTYMKGNNGISELKMIDVQFGGISFLEITDGGNIVTTAIDKNNLSVHSRNSIIMGELVASQYYGKCIKNVN